MRSIAIWLWFASLLCCWQSCEASYAAGGWTLIWTVGLLHVAADLLAKLGAYAWKR